MDNVLPFADTHLSTFIFIFIALPMLHAVLGQSELYGEVFKLVDDAPHRWLGLVRVMERVLALFSALRTHYHHHEAKPFPLKDSETVLPELFALVQPISDIIKESQGILTSSAGKIVIRMAKLKTGVLNCDVSLAVSDGRKKKMFVFHF